MQLYTPDQFMKPLVPMPPSLEKKLNALDLEVRNLFFKWQYFSQLFTDPYDVGILNAAAGAIFVSIEDSMLSDILLSINRLTDPSKTGKQENLSFENVIQEIPDTALQAKVLAILSDIKDKTKVIKTWRDKKLSHNDLSKALGGFVLPPIQKKDLTDTLDLIPKIINLIQGHYNDTEIRYDLSVTPPNGGKALLMYLEYGFDVLKEDLRNSNMDRLHRLRRNREQRAIRS